MIFIISLFIVICLSNIYLYLYNKFLNKKLQKIEHYFGFITNNYSTNIYYRELVNTKDVLVQKKFNTDSVLKKWIKLKEKQTFIYYSISTKKSMNVRMNIVFSGLLLITIFLLYFC